MPISNGKFCEGSRRMKGRQGWQVGGTGKARSVGSGSQTRRACGTALESLQGTGMLCRVWAVSPVPGAGG